MEVGWLDSSMPRRGRRLFAAGECPRGGGMGRSGGGVRDHGGSLRSTIGRGLKDLDAAPLPKGRERRKGGGRRHLSSRDATLIEDLRSVIEPLARSGDSCGRCCVSRKAYAKVADALQEQGHEISASSVKRLLLTLGYSRQSNPQGAGRGPSEASRPQWRNSSTSTPGRSPPRLRGSPSSSVDYQEEGADRQLQERWHRLSPERRSAAREGARLRGQGARQGRTLAAWTTLAPMQAG